MGFNRSSFSNLDFILRRLNLRVKNMVGVEFGVQQSWFSSKTFPPASYYKDLFGKNFKEFYSFDLDPVEGVIVTDLSKPLDFPRKADFFMDFGTAEHVGTTPEEAYQFWLNCHNICNEGAVMLHDLPEVGSWPGHCHWWFDERFFKTIAEKCDYQLVEIKVYPIKDQGFNIFAAFIKRGPGFISFDDFKEVLKDENYM